MSGITGSQCYAAVTHACCVCGWQWHSETKKDAENVIAAAKVNGDGPYCVLCLHLEMAARYATARGYPEVRIVMNEWRRHNEKGSLAPPAMQKNSL